MLKPMLIAAAIVALLAGVAGAEDEAAPETKPLNEICPVMPDEKVDPAIFTDYQGKRVWFCCEGCIDDFKADPSAYLSLLPQFRGVAAPEAAPPESAAPAPGAAAAEPGPREKHPLGGLHPILVHFPVALTVVAALAYLVSLLFAGKFLRNFATLTIVIAAAVAVPANLMGEEAEDALGKVSDSRHERIEDHEKWGAIAMYVVIGVAVFTFLSRILPESGAMKVLVVLALIGAMGVMGYTGYLGGEVVRPGHLEHLGIF